MRSVHHFVEQSTLALSITAPGRYRLLLLSLFNQKRAQPSVLFASFHHHEFLPSPFFPSAILALSACRALLEQNRSSSHDKRGISPSVILLAIQTARRPIHRSRYPVRHRACIRAFAARRHALALHKTRTHIRAWGGDDLLRWVRACLS